MTSCCRKDTIVASRSMRDLTKFFHLLISMGNMRPLCNKVDKVFVLVNIQQDYRECGLLSFTEMWLVQDSFKNRWPGEYRAERKEKVAFAVFHPICHCCDLHRC